MPDDLVEVDNTLSGVERAAVFLLSLGEDRASEVLKHMGPKEVQALGAAMADLANVSKSQVTSVLGDFITIAEDQTSLGVGNDEYIRNMLTNALGVDKANGIIDRILFGKNSKGLEQLKWMDARQTAEMIRVEHPQIIAIILAYLDNDQSAEVLSLLPENMRLDVMMRIASLDGIQPNALSELNDIMEKQFAGDSASSIKSSSVGGVKAAADILNVMETAIENDIMDQMKEIDPDLGQKILDNMFVFANLAELDDRGIQMLLRETSTDNLVTALKGADNALKEKIFKNMSKRAGEMLRDDLEAKGPVRLSEVEEAQKEIIAIARRMTESGEISLGGKGDEFVS
jgi:flagellar motor switch protein FliG